MNMSKSKVFIFGGGFMGKELLSGINTYLKRGQITTFEPVIVEGQIHSKKDAEDILNKIKQEHGEPFAI